MSSPGPASRLEQSMNECQNLLKAGEWISRLQKDPIGRGTQKTENKQEAKDTRGSGWQKPGIRADLKFTQGHLKEVGSDYVTLVIHSLIP